MDWKYELKRILRGRQGKTAVLFLLTTVILSISMLCGVVRSQTECGGYDRPGVVKGDVTAPFRTLSAPPADLNQTSQTPFTHSWDTRFRQKTAAIEGAVDKAMEAQHGLIQLYGAVEKTAGRTVVEDVDPANRVVKLPDGSLTFVGGGDPDAQAQAMELERLRLALADRDIPLLYLQAPNKLEPGAQVLPTGVYDTGNAGADRLLEQLDLLGIDYLDFRQVLKDAQGDWGDWFYRTDHHWNQDGAFLAWEALREKLTQYRRTSTVARGSKVSAVTLDDPWGDRESYEQVTLREFFLGSQGKRVGSLYGGVDDFTLWTPKGATLLRYSFGNTNRYGTLEETVLFPEQVEERNWFDDSPYTYYAGRDYALARAVNYYNPDGPRVLMVRDSYAGALTPFLALSCSELTTVDSRYFTGDFMSYVDALKPDVVMILYSPGSVRREGSFRLLKQPAAPGKGDLFRWETD